MTNYSILTSNLKRGFVRFSEAILSGLSRNLSAFKGGGALLENYLRKIKGVINERTILIVDDSDITKPCSRKMEALHVVRDGSTGAYGIG